MKTDQESVRIRDGQPEELGDILKLTLEAYSEFEKTMPIINWSALKPAIFKTLKNPGDAEIIVADLENEILGSVLLFPPKSNAYDNMVERANWPEMRLLAVKTTARGMGIGNMLMNECIMRARQSGAQALGLHTSASMTVAQPMYQRRGFERVPEYDFDVPGGELVEAYKLDLTPR